MALQRKVMDQFDRATEMEELDRAEALASRCRLRFATLRREICTGCSYATRTSFSKSCEAWAECLADLQKRERARR